MININKPKVAPLKLASAFGRGVRYTKIICDLYDTDPMLFADSKAYVIKGSIYNATNVKRTLKTIQKKKCCFCEKMHNDEFGAVEHFRPKMGYQILRSDALVRPGYYWKGYSWDNLFYVCGPCNTAKGNIFPLKNEANRATNHHSLTKEVSLIINPAGRMNPRKHIKFVNEFPVPLSDYGRKTIEACQLDREGLNEERRIHLNEIKKSIKTIIRGVDPIGIKIAKKHLRNSIKNNSKFSAMVIDYIAKSNIVIT
jgi:hypothetical protein